MPVLEAEWNPRIGRFGWKSQHASLQSFSADAYLNEMRITSPLLPEENTSSGTPVGFGTPFDPVPDPEERSGVVAADHALDQGPPSRGPITRDVLAGKRVFDTLGCAVCHVPSIAPLLRRRSSTAGRSRFPRLSGTR